MDHELGVSALSWQEDALEHMLACDRRGRLVHSLYVNSAGRQNGKTTIVRGVVGWALTAAPFAWERVLGLAYDRPQARVLYDAVLADLGGPGMQWAIARATRFRGILSRLGRRYDVASKDAGLGARGLTTDLGIFDEVMTQRTTAVWEALLPTVSARPDALILGLSTAGDARSVLLREWWERGLRIIDRRERAEGFGMSWWAAPEGAPPGSLEAITAANPAYGLTLRPAAVAAERLSLSASAWKRERLNLWVETADDWLPPDAWERSAMRRTITADPGTVALGVDVAPGWRRATIAVCAPMGDGTWHAAVVADMRPAEGRIVAPAELEEAMIRATEEWGPLTWTWDANAAAAAQVERITSEHDWVAHPFGGAAIVGAHETFYSELIAGRLTHEPDALVTAGIANARSAPVGAGGGWRLSRRVSLGPIDPILAVIYSSAAAIAPERVEGPSVW
jgi:phage terminase large subunit-like protein